MRKAALVSFVRVLLIPIDTIYSYWYNWRLDNIYKLENTGQVCSLRGSLNDKFDPALRRIYIGSGQQYEPFYIYTEGENQDVWMHTDAENDIIWLYTDTETAESGFDFLVYVPQEVYNTQIFGLHAHIDFYKAGGKQYNILIIP